MSSKLILIIDKINANIFSGDKMKEIYIYTDGACSGNPGKGGWGAVLVYKGVVRYAVQ